MPVSKEVQFKSAYIFFIGGAGDKERYGIIKKFPLLGWGPTNLVGDYKIAFEKNSIWSRSLKKKLRCYYYSYLEKDKIILLINRLQKKYPKDKIFTAAIGHSYGGSAACFVCSRVREALDVLITVDPAGSLDAKFFSNLVALQKKSSRHADFKVFAAVVPESNILVGANSVALLGGAWRNRQKVIETLNDQSTLLIRCKDKKIGHRNFAELMTYRQKNSSMEDILITNIKNFFQAKLAATSNPI